jgi:CRISPR-associated Cas5-like protein
VRRPPLPAFIADVVAEPRARNALLAGSAALFAAGLDPRVWSASLPSVQAAIRERPELEAVSLVAAVIGAALLLVGGVLGDSQRARPIVLGGLLVELVASAIALVLPDGPAFVASRFVGTAAASFVIPVSLAAVATSYHGVPRATAIGLAYGAYGASQGLGPALLQALPDSRWPAFAAAILACVIAIVVARRRLPDLARPTVVERPYVVATALWGLGIVTLTSGIIWFGSGWDNPVRWALILLGGLALAAAGAHDRRRQGRATIHVERRPVAIAVFVGLILALAQTVPMLELPLYFQLVLRYGPLLAIAALGPLFAGLILAGPVAGFLLARFAPRTLVGAGVLAVGVGDLVLALVAAPGAGYLGFVVPCVLVGAGFVVATTVRTAIIFASVPRGLPATAAALNEASIAVGTRIGVVLVTAVVAQAALAAFSASLGGLSGPEADRSLAAFRDLLTAVGTPSFADLSRGVDPASFGPYAEAYTTGVRVALVCGAVVAIAGGAVAWLFLGRQDPLATVYEHRDERGVGQVEA